MTSADGTEPQLTRDVPAFASADEDAAAILSITPEAEAAIVARSDERFLAEGRRRVDRRIPGVLLLVLLVHAALLAAFLWKDARTTIPATQIAETPIEVVVEPPPPEPLKPPEPPKPPQPEPPRPKEDLSPAMSAPRAPNEDNVKTTTKEAKTAAPNQLATPTQGQPQPPATAAPPPPAETAPAQKQDEAAKEEDLSKPDAEALDKAKKAAKAKESKTKEAKAAPPRKPVPNALAALAGAPTLGAMSFAKPTPKTKIYGGTEDVRWMSEVEAMLEAKVQKLPHTAHYQAGGKVAICFHVDVSGRVILNDFCLKSGYPDIDQMAMRALVAAAPFPPPPPGLERGLIWISTFDGQVPVLHFR